MVRFALGGVPEGGELEGGVKGKRLDAFCVTFSSVNLVLARLESLMLADADDDFGSKLGASAFSTACSRSSSGTSNSSNSSCKLLPTSFAPKVRARLALGLVVDMTRTPRKAGRVQRNMRVASRVKPRGDRAPCHRSRRRCMPSLAANALPSGLARTRMTMIRRIYAVRHYKLPLLRQGLLKNLLPPPRRIVTTYSPRTDSIRMTLLSERLRPALLFCTLSSPMHPQAL